MLTDTVSVQLGPPAVVHGTASGLATVSAAPLPAAAAAAAPAVRTASAAVPVRAGRLLPPLLRVESRSFLHQLCPATTPWVRIWVAVRTCTTNNS
jgi:hypothetical protein